MTSKRISIALVAIMLVSVVGVGLVAAAGPSDELSYTGDDSAPNPTFKDDVTVAKHPMSQGTTDDAMAAYYDDNGDWTDADFVVNTTSDVETGDNVNPYTLDPAKIEDPDREEFPRTDGEEGENSASILDASEWNSVTGDTSMSDTTIASNVPVVQLATNGSMAAGNSIEMGYANWSSSYDSDEDKRVLQLAGEVNSMDAGASVNISLEDEDGDRKTVMIEPDATQDTNVSVAYGQTSGTFTYQVKLANLPFDDGSGTWDNIESVNVTVVEADADIDLSWLAFNKKAKTTLAEKQVDDGDSDSDYDNFNTTYNATGTVSTHSIGTLDADFDDATLTDVTFPVKKPVSMMPGSEGEEAEYVLEWEETDDYPGFDVILNVTYRDSLPTPIDITWSSPTLELEQGEPDGRYLELGVAEDVADSTNLSEVSLSDKTGSLASVGDWIELDGSVTAGQDYVTGFEVKLTGDERTAYEAAAGGGGQFEEEGGGGSIWDQIFGIPGMIVGSLLTAVGFRKLGRRISGA